ncbi:MAG: class II aldolase/adducin family protein [Anaerolineales bacterium]|nr:class II aldolase/adducin family protein [Anaerolineales bacterium]
MEHVSRALCQDIIFFARRTAEMGLVPNTQGNVSARDPQTGLIAITPHDMHYGELSADDLVIVDESGKKIAGRFDPSYETPVHCTAYRERPDLFAMIHTEPPYVGCLGAVGIPIDTVVASLLVNLGGPIPIMPYMPSGSDAFGYEMVRVMNGGYGVVWANHGLMTAGRTVDEAFRRTVIVEHAAQIYHLALLHGKPTIVTHEMFHGGVA